MPATKTERQVSERLLTIDWGQPPSGRHDAIAGAPARAPITTDVRVRLDEVFQHINAYRALVDSAAPVDGLLARSLVNQANAIFNQGVLNLQKRFNIETVYVDGPLNEADQSLDDITAWLVHEVQALQNVVAPEL
ncbi:MAG: hypothetical protein IT462_16910 [Planctomycetes bacterium]|nr:hypothetical protein [Planctomycetota bacterium]